MATAVITIATVRTVVADILSNCSVRVSGAAFVTVESSEPALGASRELQFLSAERQRSSKKERPRVLCRAAL